MQFSQFCLIKVALSDHRIFKKINTPKIYSIILLYGLIYRHKVHYTDYFMLFPKTSAIHFILKVSFLSQVPIFSKHSQRVLMVCYIGDIWKRKHVFIKLKISLKYCLGNFLYGIVKDKLAYVLKVKGK